MALGTVFMNNMLTFEEVKNFLEIDQQEIEKHLKEGKLHAYKIGGTYVRFRKEEVLNLRFEVLPGKGRPAANASFGARLRDFWRFNNFYIVSVLLIIALAVLVIRL